MNMGLFQGMIARLNFDCVPLLRRSLIIDVAEVHALEKTTTKTRLKTLFFFIFINKYLLEIDESILSGASRKKAPCPFSYFAARICVLIVTV